MENVKRTPLYATHAAYGGKIVEFGGWALPVQYSGIKEEHLAVRGQAGLFDVSHMGEVLVKGPDATAFVENLITNDVSRIAETQILYTPMCYADGGVVDDLLVYKYTAAHYLLVINAANIDKDFAWMTENAARFDVELQNISPDTAQLALQGPLAERILQPLTDFPLAGLKYYWFNPAAHIGGHPVLISRTGYTGEDGFEIYCRPDAAATLWEAIMQSGKPLGLLPAGLGCRDTLRFEACLPLYGHELSPELTPLEAGIGFFVKLDKGDFNGRDALAAQKAAGLKRKLVGLEMTGRGVARAGYPVVADGERIGVVTTGTYAPTLNKNLALALVDAAYASIGRELAVEIRNKPVAAQIVQKPFYKRKGN